MANWDTAAGPRAAGERLVALGLLLAALALRLFELGGKSLWGDELNMIAFARGDYDAAMSGGNAVGYFPILRCADALARLFAPGGEIGAADAWLRLPAALFGAAAVPLLYFAGCRIAGRRAGLVAALLLMVSPMHVAHSQEAHSYAAFCLAALLLYELRARGGDGASFAPKAAFAAVFAAGLYLHLFTLFVAGALLLDLLVGRLAAGKKPLAREERLPVAAAILLALALSLPMWRDWIVPYAGQLAEKRLAGAPPIIEDKDSGTAIFDNEPVFALAPSTFLRAGSQLVVWRGSFPVFSALAWLLFALGVAVLLRRSRPEGRAFLLFFFLPLLPIAAFSYLSRIDFGTRRLIFLLPLFWLAVAIALTTLGGLLAARLKTPAARRAALALPALLFLFWLGVPMLGWYYRAYEKVDFRLATRLIARFAGPDDFVLFHRPRNVFLHYRAGVESFDPEGSKPAKLERLRDGRGRIVFVRPFNVDPWPDVVPVLDWLKDKNRFDFRLGGGLRMAVVAGGTRLDSAVEAERWLRAAIEERPDRFDLWAFLAQSLQMQGREPESQAARQRADALRPERRFPTCLPWLCRQP